MDARAEAAKYYDLWPPPFDDVPFYAKRVPRPDASILELGCGTGRVLVPLAQVCANIHGIDSSEAMIDICRKKLLAAALPTEKAIVETGDITRFDLRRKFDLIIAPYRVLQNLETDEQIDGLLAGIRKHLSPDGTAILNVFHAASVDTMKQKWAWGTDGEYFCWELPLPEGGRVTCHERRAKIDTTRCAIYPETIYRTYSGGALIRESVQQICMRCHYPEPFRKLILDHGFTITGQWGGYNGEAYSEGEELVIQFADNS